MPASNRKTFLEELNYCILVVLSFKIVEDAGFGVLETEELFGLRTAIENLQGLALQGWRFFVGNEELVTAFQQRKRAKPAVAILSLRQINQEETEMSKLVKD